MTKPQTHTPGPWCVWQSQQTNHPIVVQGQAPDYTKQFTGNVISFPNMGCEDWATVDANARLIAAAPDLLAACQAALKEMQSFRDYWTSPNMNLKRSKALAEELCESAIQKATSHE